MARKGATKHCCWGLWKSDSHYLDKLLEGTEFIRFPKPGRIKESMTEWQKTQDIAKTRKAKKWLDACSGQGQFDRMGQITKNT